MDGVGTGVGIGTEVGIDFGAGVDTRGRVGTGVGIRVGEGTGTGAGVGLGTGTCTGGDVGNTGLGSLVIVKWSMTKEVDTAHTQIMCLPRPPLPLPDLWRCEICNSDIGSEVDRKRGWTWVG